MALYVWLFFVCDDPMTVESIRIDFPYGLTVMGKVLNVPLAQVQYNFPNGFAVLMIVNIILFGRYFDIAASYKTCIHDTC